MMILRPEQIQLMRMGRPVIPCNFGGDSGGSSSSASTTTNTQNIDRRMVVDNGSIGTGDHTSVNYTRNDVSGEAIKWTLAANNEATWRAAALANESGARSAALANESTARVVEAIDRAGAREAALANETSARTVDLAKTSTETGYKTLQAALGFASDTLTRSRDQFGSIVNLTRDNLSIVDKTAAALTGAYANVADVASGNKQLVAGGLIVAGIVAIVAFMVVKGKS